MADRLWMFNPGCSSEPCCEEEVNTVPCCIQNWTCNRWDMTATPTMTTPYGTLTFQIDPSKIPDSAPFKVWWACMTIPCPKTVKSVYNFNNGQTACTEIGEGSVAVQFNLSCEAGQFGLANQFFYRQCNEDGLGSIDYPDTNSSCKADGRVQTTHPFPIGMTYGANPNYSADTDFNRTFNFAATNPNTSAIYNPVQSTGDFVLTIPPLKSGVMRRTLYLNDGIGEVPMIYNGPRPVSLGTASDMWWGCATRHVTGGRAKAPSGDCAPASLDFDTQIVFGLWCKGPSEGYRLYIFHDGCGSYDDGINVQTHQRASLGCTTPWVGQYNQIVGGSINGIAARDCDPFVWGPVSQSFPATPYPYHPLREIYGDEGTWIITS